MRSLLAHTSLCIAIVVAVSACNGQAGSGSSSKAPREGVLRVAADAEPQSLDPQLTTGHTEHRILTSLFEGLTTLNQKTLEVEPGVAKTWEVSEDGKTYTFHLNPEAKWSDGSPITANDFVYSYKRILSPKLASEYSYMPWCIENAEAFNKGTIQDFAQVGVKAIDDATLQVKLAYPAPYFLSMQIHNSWFPVQQATIEKYGKIDDRQSDWILAGNMVSNGPFKLAEWKPNEIIRVVRNEHYWDAKNIKLNEIEFYPVSGNLQTAERMFRANEVDTIETLVITKVPVYKRDNPSVLRLEPFVGTYFYRINVTRPPLDDPRVRLALAMSVDKESVCNEVLFGAFTPATALTPPIELTLEYGVEFIEDDELVEITPKSVRLRKRHLTVLRAFRRTGRVAGQRRSWLKRAFPKAKACAISKSFTTRAKTISLLPRRCRTCGRRALALT